MGRKRHRRRAELRYEFDRLVGRKMEQVYDILLAKVLRDLEADEKVLAGQEKER